MLHKVLRINNAVPKSYYEAANFVSNLGLDYQMIYSCINDFILFRKEHIMIAVCQRYGQSRWIAPK